MLFSPVLHVVASRADIACCQAGIARPLRPCCLGYAIDFLRVAMWFESHRSNHTKPAFKKPSALLLFLLESHRKRPSLIANHQYWPTS